MASISPVRTLLVLGGAGHGKSHLLRRLSGYSKFSSLDDPTADGTTECGTYLSNVDSDSKWSYRFCDTPGLDSANVEADAMIWNKVGLLTGTPFAILLCIDQRHGRYTTWLKMFFNTITHLFTKPNSIKINICWTRGQGIPLNACRFHQVLAKHGILEFKDWAADGMTCSDLDHPDLLYVTDTTCINQKLNTPTPIPAPAPIATVTTSRIASSASPSTYRRVVASVPDPDIPIMSTFDCVQLYRPFTTSRLDEYEQKMKPWELDEPGYKFNKLYGDAYLKFYITSLWSCYPDLPHWETFKGNPSAVLVRYVTNSKLSDVYQALSPWRPCRSTHQINVVTNQHTDGDLIEAAIGEAVRNPTKPNKKRLRILLKYVFQDLVNVCGASSFLDE